MKENEIYSEIFRQLVEKNNGKKDIARKALYEETKNRRVSFSWDEEGNLVQAFSTDAWCE